MKFGARPYYVGIFGRAKWVGVLLRMREGAYCSVQGVRFCIFGKAFKGCVEVS